MVVDPSWVLALMLELEPKSPFRETFDRTSTAIARASERSPLPGQDANKTAAILVSVAWFESRFQPDAEGDCDKTNETGTCVKGSKPHSFCLLQIGESNFKGFRTTREEVQTNVDSCITVGLGLMNQSFRICASKPLPERLAQYAGGGPVCFTKDEARKKSGSRMAKAVWIYSHKAPPILPPRMAQDDVLTPIPSSGAGSP